MDNIHYQYVMLVEINNLDEVRLNALDHLITRKKKIEKAYNKHIQSKSLF